MRVNDEIRAPKVRVINQAGEQIGLLSLREALQLAQNDGLDLVEMVADSNPPVCKVMDFGKFRYDQTKREKESKKARHTIKVKEIKLKPNIDVHDFDTKMRHAREFLEGGDKVKITCVFRGREMAHPEIGVSVVERMVKGLEDVAVAEMEAKFMGRILNVVMAPGGKKKK